MSMFLMIFIPTFIIAVLIMLYFLFNNIMKYSASNAQVYHRLNSHNVLQYSVDSKIWTEVIAFNPEYNYGTYTGPALGYVTIEPEDNQLYDDWCNKLNTLAQCHAWNSTALHLYIDAIRNYLNENNES